MTLRRFIQFPFVLSLICAANTLWAQDLTPPGNATMTREKITPAGSYFVPLAPFEKDGFPSIETEGRIVQQAWRAEAGSLTTLQMLSPLREQLKQAGYKVLFDCSGQECGGFDFRFATDVLPAPDMFVDLFDYRFLSAHRLTKDDQTEYATVLISRSGPAGYIQITHATSRAGAGQSLTVAANDWGVPSGTGPQSPPFEQQQDTVAENLTQQGHVILRDLEFESGSATLGAGPYETLAQLAAFLREDDTRRIALVGHTDSVGALEGNIALSRQRSASVLERLVAAYDIPRRQLEAGGMGYLSPVRPNLTAEGREANRRVEAVWLNSE